jgi:hypothetical protein
MPTVVWPSSLVNRIIADRWVLFIGSGASASCKNAAGTSPPTWTSLLTELCALIASSNERKVGEALLAQRDLLGAADHIRYSLARENNVTLYEQAIRAAVEGPADDRFRPSKLFEHLLKMEPKIVFTTNYDKLFDVASENGFRPHGLNSHSLGDDIRRGEPVFVKLHGSTDEISQIVLTRTDYARAARAGHDVFDALRAVTLVSTILFVGYSLDDPDIQLVLQTVGRPGLSPEAHFMLTRKPASASRVEVFKESFGVSVLTYTGEHTRATTAIKELADAVVSARASRALA